MNKIEKEFYKTFGIEPIRYILPLGEKRVTWQDGSRIMQESSPEMFKAVEDMLSDDDRKLVKVIYPEITDRRLLSLEEIFVPYEMGEHGFKNGLEIYKYDNTWKYQLTYRKGGYYINGRGNSRKEALLDQFITIMVDKKIEKEEKQFIKHQVQSLFREVQE